MWDSGGRGALPGARRHVHAFFLGDDNTIDRRPGPAHRSAFPSDYEAVVFGTTRGPSPAKPGAKGAEHPRPLAPGLRDLPSADDPETAAVSSDAYRNLVDGEPGSEVFPRETGYGRARPSTATDYRWGRRWNYVAGHGRPHCVGN